MQISQDTQNVIDFLQKYSENTLKAKDDVALFLELAASTNNVDLLSDMIFTGTAIQNSIISLSRESEADKDLVKKELIRLQEKFSNQIISLSESADKTTIGDFNKYSDPSSKSLDSIINLSHDFSILKRMQNEIRFEDK